MMFPPNTGGNYSFITSDPDPYMPNSMKMFEKSIYNNGSQL
jgi:hypothetical protein